MQVRSVVCMQVTMRVFCVTRRGEHSDATRYFKLAATSDACLQDFLKTKSNKNDNNIKRDKNN